MNELFPQLKLLTILKNQITILDDITTLSYFEYDVTNLIFIYHLFTKLKFNTSFQNFFTKIMKRVKWVNQNGRKGV